MKQYGALDDTFYLWFGANDTSGSGGDGASPVADVRLAGAAADAAPIYSPTPSLLSHVNYPAGAYEIAITASAGNGFAANNTYAVFCTLVIDSQNPTGFVGSFDLKPVVADAIRVSGDAIAADNLEKDYDGTGYDKASSTIGTCTTNTDVTTLNDISVADIIAGIADGTYDLQEMMRLILAACVCKSSGGGTTTIKMRDSGDAKDRISTTVDVNGNRTAVTLDGS